MKKIIASICLMLLTANFAGAVTEKPSFSEICPAVYYHQKTFTKDDVKMKNIIPVPVVVLGYIDFIVPGLVMNAANVKHKTKVLDRYNSAVEYWQGREDAFNKKIEQCSASTNVNSCYEQVLEEEKSLNENLSNKLNGKDFRLTKNKKGALVLKN